MSREAAPAAVGTVYLVGAGPGDPGLLTVRAAELLRSAEVVAHDALIPESVLACIGRSAERVCVGRRHGSGRLGWRLHPAIAERALAGQDVVRLKAGDPLVFGRGGEEAEELCAAGIPFQIVPGISSALAAGACAGIPLTHRELASDVCFASGHDAAGRFPSHTDWQRLGAGTGTLVLFMATRQLGENLARLVRAGRDPATPAACISRAARPDQNVVVGTIGDLATRVERARVELPALVVVGEVVAAREAVAWREAMPLIGAHVLVGRATERRSTIAAKLRALGARVTESPLHVEGRGMAVEPLGAIDLVVLPNAAAGEALLAGPRGTEWARRPIVVTGERSEAVARLHGAVEVIRAGRSADEVVAAARRRLVRLSSPGAAGGIA